MHKDYFDRPAFEIIAPKRVIAPLVFNSAHSGREYPKRFLEMSRLDKNEIRLSEDAYIDELFSYAPNIGAPLLRAFFPRAYLDVNREPFELDPEMFFETLPKNYNTNSPRVRAGIGTIAKIVAKNKPIYKGKLTLKDAQTRIEKIYRPYHLALQKLLTKTHEKFGFALLIDCHSMPNLSGSNFGFGKFASFGERFAPDIILGDRFGNSCSNIIVELIENYFAGYGLKVARNRPYAGGFIVNSYANPAHNIHAIQIEISRHLYMNEANFAKNDNFYALKNIIDNLIKMLVEIDIMAMTNIHSNAAQ